MKPELPQREKEAVAKGVSVGAYDGLTRSFIMLVIPT